MQFVAALAILSGLGFAIGTFFKKRRLDLLEGAESVSVSEARNDLLDGEIVELSGSIQCAYPLVSELAEVKCVHYRMSVNYEYEIEVESKDSSGKTETEIDKKTRNLASNERQVSFDLSDESGIIKVDPELAEFKSEKVLSDFRVDNRDEGGSIQIGGLRIKLPGADPDMLNPVYRYTEYAIPIDRQIYVLGQVDHSGSEPVIRKPDKKEPLIISLSSKATLQTSARKSVKTTGIISAVLISLGIGALVYWLFF